MSEWLDGKLWEVGGTKIKEVEQGKFLTNVRKTFTEISGSSECTDALKV